MKVEKDKRGITLISLVITVIVLVILSSISIAQLMKNSFLEKAELAKEKSDVSKKIEDKVLNEYETEILNYISGTRTNGSGVKVVTAWEGTNNSGTVSLGDYDISDYDFIYLSVKYTKDFPGMMSSIYMVKEIISGTSKIGVFNNGRGIWYEVTNNNTLTYDSGDDIIALKTVYLIKL